MAEVLIKLPPPDLKGKKTVEEAIATRRSVRRYKAEPLSISQLSQILWSAQGITTASKYRAIPSAGATFPLEAYTLVGEQTVAGLKAGIYHYEANSHSLRLHLDGDFRHELAEAALSQGFLCPFLQNYQQVRQTGRNVCPYGSGTSGSKCCFAGNSSWPGYSNGGCLRR
jgi:nitroreductase